MEAINSLYERWNQLPRWQRWLLSILAGLILFFALRYFLINPTLQELEAKRKVKEQLQLTVSRLKIVEKNKEKLDREIAELTQKIEEIENQLPTGKEEVSQIIRTITADTDGIVLESIRRKGERKKEKTRGKKGKKTVEKKVQKPEKETYYREYTYEVNLKGTYPTFVKWCEAVSQAERILDFGNLEVKALEKPEDGYTVEAKVELKAFTLKK